MVNNFEIAPARKEHANAIWELIRELAEYERLTDLLTGSTEQLANQLFVEKSAEALVALANGKVVGYAIFFPSFSTFRTQRGIWMEDLYVTPSFRRQGIGTALLRHVSKIAAQRGCTRHEWSVLDWNEDAIKFYRSIGAIVMNEWKTCRLEDEALAQQASLSV